MEALLPPFLHESALAGILLEMETGFFPLSYVKSYGLFSALFFYNINSGKGVAKSSI